MGIIQVVRPSLFASARNRWPGFQIVSGGILMVLVAAYENRMSAFAALLPVAHETLAAGSVWSRRWVVNQPPQAHHSLAGKVGICRRLELFMKNPCCAYRVHPIDGTGPPGVWRQGAAHCSGFAIRHTRPAGRRQATPCAAARPGWARR